MLHEIIPEVKELKLLGPYKVFVFPSDLLFFLYLAENQLRKYE